MHPAGAPAPNTSTMDPASRPPTLRRAAAGGLAAAVALATSVLVDGLSASAPSLVLSVGQAVIRWSPGSVARQGVETFGTADKPLLVAGIVVLSVAIRGR